MNKITSRQTICDTLMEAAKTGRGIVVLCSDSRGSASLAPFFRQYPKQRVEIGIAEQNFVTVAVGLALYGKKSFAVSPASLLSTRSYEQVKVDATYSGNNVTLVGINGGISYGALGMTHHFCQDVAAFTALPGIRVYVPSDRSRTAIPIKTLLKDDKPAYIGVNRSATEDVYDDSIDFSLDGAQVIKEEQDVLIVTYGEMVPNALQAAGKLEADGIRAGVIDIYCLKPFDERTLLEYVGKVRLVITIEEHFPYGGLGSLIALILARHSPEHVLQIALPDGHIVAGANKEVFTFCGMDADGIVKQIKRAVKEV